MKEVPISNSERAFIADVIANKQRLDGRDLDHHRPLKINFGADWGSVHVSLGETRVLAQVTCTVAQPKATRPTEGLLFLKLDIGPMAAAHFEANRPPTDLAVQVNRILERAFKDSNCVDLESLCIKADEKVWALQVDLNVLNHEGNVVDCASVAVLAALAHFKRPDVTIDGDEVIVHTLAQKDPIGMVLHHYPVCVSYGIFQNGAIAVADPTALEERCAEAQLVFGLNSYRELCGLHFGGVTMASSQLLLKCAARGASHARYVVQLVKDAVRADADQRTAAAAAAGGVAASAVSFTECVRLNKITALAQDRLTIRLKRFQLDDDAAVGDDDEEEDDDDEAMDADEEDVKPLMDDSVVVSLNRKSAALVPQTPKWLPESDCEHSDDDEEDEDDEQLPGEEVEPKPVPVPVQPTAATAKPKKSKKSKAKNKPTVKAQASDSEEETTVLMDTIPN